MVASTPDKPAAKSSLGLRIALRALLLLAILVAGFMFYSWLALTWSYSEGERAGILQKFSLKGWVCKTYEGELAISIVPGVTPTIWDFSVRDEVVVKQVEQALGKRVVLHYKEHRGVPSDCFGETGYFVDNVRIVE